MKSYLYSRISTLQQVQGFGIERQILNVTDFLENAVIDSRLGYQLDPNDYEILESDSCGMNDKVPECSAHAFSNSFQVVAVFHRYDQRHLMN